MDLYSKRKRTEENLPTTIRYDLSEAFRNQVIFIWAQAAGYTEQPVSRSPIAPYDLEKMRILVANQLFNQVRTDFCEAHGLLGLPDDGALNAPCLSIRTFFQRCPDDAAIDIIVLTFNATFVAERTSEFIGYVQPKLTASEAVMKLNQRFREHAIGYRLEQGQIVRLDSEFLHSETTEPALILMHTKGYEGALEEFQLAHKHYRNGSEHYDDCLTNCGKSLESTLKTICDRRKWTYSTSDTALKLLNLVFAKELVPRYLQSHFGALRATLESGVPTIRNREGGHGSGEKPNEVPEYLAAYQLHLTASAIVFLIRANDDFGKHNS